MALVYARTVNPHAVAHAGLDGEVDAAVLGLLHEGKRAVGVTGG